jgi:hypothetical protein
MAHLLFHIASKIRPSKISINAGGKKIYVACQLEKPEREEDVEHPSVAHPHETPLGAARRMRRGLGNLDPVVLHEALKNFAATEI